MCLWYLCPASPARPLTPSTPQRTGRGTAAARAVKPELRLSAEAPVFFLRSSRPPWPCPVPTAPRTPIGAIAFTVDRSDFYSISHHVYTSHDNTHDLPVVSGLRLRCAPGFTRPHCRPPPQHQAHHPQSTCRSSHPARRPRPQQEIRAPVGSRPLALLAQVLCKGMDPQSAMAPALGCVDPTREVSQEEAGTERSCLELRWPLSLQRHNC